MKTSDAASPVASSQVLVTLIAFVAVAVIYFTKVQVNWAEIDGWLSVLATFIGFIVQMFGSKVTYVVTKGAPVIGFSYSNKANG